MAKQELNAIGIIELSSISKGYFACDAMLKAAEVELILARSICPGKYMAMVRGDVDAVYSSVSAGTEAGDEAIVDTFVIPNVHESVFPAINAVNEIGKVEALGIIETFSVASLIESADAAVKTAKVKLIEIRLAMAIGGKAFCTLTGEVAAVRSAVDAGAMIASKKGLLVNKVVIPSPHPDAVREIV
ncbi:MAG: BMC domain-containing protein [bacterium]|nr:BMC domain-containing protein [bacterium]